MSEQWSGQEPSTREGSSETSSTTDAAKAEAGNLAQTSKQSAGQVAGTAKEQGQQVLSEATSQARNLVGETKSQLGQQAGAQQQRAAASLQTLSQQLNDMATVSDSGVASQLVRQASEQVQQVAGWLDRRDPSGMLEDVRSFARRKPGTFLIGAAGAGLLAGRMTRAGVDIKRADSSSDSEYDRSRYGYPAGETYADASAEAPYPYDTTDVGGTAGTYASGTYAGDTYTADTYTGDTYADQSYTGDQYTEQTAGGTYAGGTHAAPTETTDDIWTDPGEPQR